MASEEATNLPHPSNYAVTFLTGRELRALDDDPVLDRRDYWEGSP